MKLSSLLFSVPKLFTFNLTWEVKIHKHSKASLESLIFHWQGFQNSRSLSSNFQTLTIGTMTEHHFETSVHTSPLCPRTAAAVTFSSLQYDCKHLTLASNCIWKACLQHKATLFTNKPLPALNNIPSLSFHFQQQEAWTATLSWDFGPDDRFILINLLWAWPTFFVFNSRVPPILATLGGNASKQRKQWNLAGVVIMPGI